MDPSSSTSDAERRALDAYVKLARAAAAVETTVHRPLAEAGLTISQFGVLEALLHLGPMSQGALARKILKSPANLTTVLDNLGRRDLIRRRRDLGDRRIVLVQLTGAGEALVASLFPKHARRVAQAFEALDPDELDTLGRLCRELGLAQAEPAGRPGRDPAATRPATADAGSSGTSRSGTGSSGTGSSGTGVSDPTTPYDPARPADAAGVHEETP